MIDRLLWLIYSHAIGDMALQSPLIAVYKNWHNPMIVNGVEVRHYWLFVLIAHSLICGACAAVAVRWAKGGLIIAASHFLIDFASSNGMPFILDQMLHFVALVALAYISLKLRKEPVQGVVGQGSYEDQYHLKMPCK